ncbi:hypothetical protein H6F75_00540 [Nodosilinea sp. FACHB-131]|uniref:hypothetical protein n=1 Tax=Cyanophyceae TaxID=3028117 RepID=UPI00168226B2|nr:hypothetical protein [Nodosilinea sp. FACHB-131]MBD1871958.1 hypothetical protein [Nodosilinea sp. FACHB-131]
MLPNALRDRPMEALAEHLKASLNDRLWAIFDEADQPREDACRVAVPYRPDLLSTKVYPLISCYRTGRVNVSEDRWRGELRWHMPMATNQQSEQQHYLYWVEKSMVDILDLYQDAEEPCIIVDMSVLRSTLGYLTVTRGNPQTALSFPTVQIDFEFIDLESKYGVGS